MDKQIKELKSFVEDTKFNEHYEFSIGNMRGIYYGMASDSPASGEIHLAFKDTFDKFNSTYFTH